MALLPPDSTGRRDPGKDAAARRQRARFARDVGDEHGQAWAHEPRRRRSKLTVGVAVVFVVFVVLGALPLLLHKGDGGLVQPNCDTPAVEAGPGRIKAGANFAWQAAGPVIGPYVVTLDASAVTGPPTGPVAVDGGRVLSGPTGLSGCRSAQTVTAGPTAKGSHEVALFRRSATGWNRVAVALLDVS
jgi:hypothetical protein